VSNKVNSLIPKDTRADVRKNSTLTQNFNHIWLVRSINEGTMKQIQLFDYYVLGKALESLFEVNSATLENDAGFTAMAACKQLDEVIRPDSVFLAGTRRVAQSLKKTLIAMFGDGIQNGLPVFWNEESEETLGGRAGVIVDAVQAFETVFKNDSPSMSTFSTERKGIYWMEGLIDHADEHLPEPVCKFLPEQGRKDIKAAGRCLAFNIPTATAFHMWRALEVVFGAYFFSITGKTFKDAKVPRNWGKYIEALVHVGADRKITENLDHIRAEYRNPVMHPNVNVSPEMAFTLFGIGFSAITQVMQALLSQPFAADALALKAEEQYD
jgi:hypothetical protein